MTEMLLIKAAPRRMLTPKEAAIYCGEATTTFEGNCPYPPMKNSAGKKQYDIKDLDAWLDARKKPDPNSREGILEKLRGDIR